MEKETLTPEEEAEKLRLAKLAEEEEEDEDFDLDFDEEEDESLTDSALAAYNKRVGKNYKSWDDVAKRDKDIDVAFAKKEIPTPKKPQTPIKEEPKGLPTNLDERLLRAEEPTSKYVMEKMKAVAEKTGQTLDEIWNDDTGYFRGIATSMAEKEKAKSRLGVPSGAGGEEEVKKKDEMSKKFMDKYPLPPGIISKR